MSTPKRGLGRGLSALLGDASVPTANAQIVRDIPLSDITPNPFQPRKAFDAASLDELKTSIAEYGVLVPVIVRRRADGYELIAGERRWRACAALAATDDSRDRSRERRSSNARIRDRRKPPTRRSQSARGSCRISISHRRVWANAGRARAKARKEPPRGCKHAATARALRRNQGDARR